MAGASRSVSRSALLRPCGDISSLVSQQIYIWFVFVLQPSPFSVQADLQETRGHNGDSGRRSPPAGWHWISSSILEVLVGGLHSDDGPGAASLLHPLLAVPDGRPLGAENISAPGATERIALPGARIFRVVRIVTVRRTLFTTQLNMSAFGIQPSRPTWLKNGQKASITTSHFPTPPKSWFG